jgi:integrase
VLLLRSLADLNGCLPRVEKVLRDLKRKGCVGKTLANYAENLRAFCRWCVKRGYLDEDPLAGLVRFDVTPQTVRRAISPEEIHRLLAVAPPERRLLYEVALSTGLRAKELRSLTVGHLDVEQGGLRLDAAWTKNRLPGFQPLPAQVTQRLAAWSKDKKRTEPLLVVQSHPARPLDTDLKRAGISKHIPGVGKLDFYAFRTAYTTMVIESGATVKEAQALLRHSTPTMTMNTYARTRPERLAEVAQQVGDIVLGQNHAPTWPQWPSGANKAVALSRYRSIGYGKEELVAAVGLEPTTRGL